MRFRADDEWAVEVPCSAGDTIAAVLRELLREKPGLDGHVLDADGQLFPYVSVFLGWRDIRLLEGMESRMAEATDISLFPPVVGG